MSKQDTTTQPTADVTATDTHAAMFDHLMPPLPTSKGKKSAAAVAYDAARKALRPVFIELAKKAEDLQRENASIRANNQTLANQSEVARRAYTDLETQVNRDRTTMLAYVQVALFIECYTGVELKVVPEGRQERRQTLTLTDPLGFTFAFVGDTLWVQHDSQTMREHITLQLVPGANPLSPTSWSQLVGYIVRHVDPSTLLRQEPAEFAPRPKRSSPARTEAIYSHLARVLSDRYGIDIDVIPFGSPEEMMQMLRENGLV